MPELLDPVAACSNELKSMPELEEEPDALDNNEFSEDTELMESGPWMPRQFVM